MAFGDKGTSRLSVFESRSLSSLASQSTSPQRACCKASELRMADSVSSVSVGPRVRLSAWLIQEDGGRPLGTFATRSRFDKARKTAGVDFQFRDLREGCNGYGRLGHASANDYTPSRNQLGINQHVTVGPTPTLEIESALSIRRALELAL